MKPHNFTAKCGFWWKAPYLHPPPSFKVTHVDQQCSLPRGHDGPHRSLTNVIKEQFK